MSNNLHRYVDFVCQTVDDVLQFFHVDNIYSTLKDNPLGSKSSSVLCLTPPGSTRYYQFIMKDSVFNERNNDVNLLFGILGQFNEDYVVLNVTVSNSQITRMGGFFLSVRNLTVHGLHYTSIINQGQFLFHGVSGVAILNNVTINGTAIETSQSKFIRITGIGSVVSLSSISIRN